MPTSLRLSRRSAALCLAGLALWRFAPPTFAQKPEEGSIADKVSNLKAGEFLWEPEVAPAGPVLVIVSLTTQRAYVYRNGLMIGISTSSTGKPGHETPKGIFTILQKQVDHKSNLYDDAPMPFMQRLTWGGIALHAGNLPGYPASHGCIRLPLAFARNLYGISRLGMTVVIMEGNDVPRVGPSPDMLASPTILPDRPANVPPDQSEQTFWKPGLSATGPVSIIISGADRQMLVLRNGTLIGSAPVGFEAPLAQPSAFTLVSIAADGPHWVRLPLLGDQVAGAEVTEAERANVLIPDAFRQEVREVLAAGATLVITPDSLKAGGAGQHLTVMTGQR